MGVVSFGCTTHLISAVSWSDHKLGEAMALLETLDVADRTITVFHSDHGWQVRLILAW